MKLARILGLDSVAAISHCTVADAVESLPVSPTVPRAELDEFHQTYGFRLSPDLDQEKRYQALEILHRHNSVFARDLSEIKKCKAEPLKLELHTNRKMFKRQYPLSDPDK